MKLTIKDKKENKLLSRLEVAGDLSFEAATPSNEDVKKEVAKAVGKDEKLVIIKGIYTDYGISTAKVEAYVYNDEAKMKELEEFRKKAKKNKEGGEEKSAEKPTEKAEEKKEEAPKEEKKE